MPFCCRSSICLAYDIWSCLPYGHGFLWIHDLIKQRRRVECVLSCVVGTKAPCSWSSSPLGERWDSSSWIRDNVYFVLYSWACFSIAPLNKLLNRLLWFLHHSLFQKSYLLLFYVNEYLAACVLLLFICLMPMEAGRGHHEPCNWSNKCLWVTMWVLGT